MASTMSISSKTKESGKPETPSTSRLSVLSKLNRLSLGRELRWSAFRPEPKRASQNPLTFEDGGQRKRSPIEALPPELLFEVFSYLRIFEFFPLRLASHHLLFMITTFQQSLPTLDEYCADVFSTYRFTVLWRGGMRSDKRLSLNLAASRGQDALVLAIMKEGKASANFNYGERSALSYAAEHGFVHTVALLLKLKECKLRYRDKDGKNALDYAAGAGKMEMVRFLLRKGCKVDSNMKKRERDMKRMRMLHGNRPTCPIAATPLLCAVRGQQIEMVKFLLSVGASKHLKREMYGKRQSDSVLEAALCTGNLEIAHILQSAGASMDSDILAAPLDISIDEGRVEVVKFLLQDIPLSERPFLGGTPSVRSCGNGLITREHIKMLLDNNWPLNSQCHATTPLFRACAIGNIEIIKILLDNGASLDRLSERGGQAGASALLKAVENNNIEVLKYLIQRGAEPSKDRSANHSLLHMATSQENYEIMELLLESGCRVEALDHDGRTALHAAIGRTEYFNMRGLQMLLRAGASQADANDARSTKAWKETLGVALLYATHQQNPSAVEEIMKYSPRLDYQWFSGHTSLHVAVDEGHQKIISLLLRNGAYKLSHEALEKELLHATIQRNSVTVEEILKYCPRLDYQDSDGCTALHYAAVKGDMKILSLLVANGASLEVKDNIGLTPLLAAAFVKYQEPMAALISAGANRTVKDIYGRSDVDLMNDVGNGSWFHTGNNWESRFRPPRDFDDYGIGGGCG